MATLLQFDVSSPKGDGPSSSQQTSRIDFVCLPSEYVTPVPLVKPLRRESGVLQLSSTPTLLDHPPPRVCLAYRDVHRSTRSRPSAGSSREGLDLLRFSETIQDEYLQNISATIGREDFLDVFGGHLCRGEIDTACRFSQQRIEQLARSVPGLVEEPRRRWLNNVTWSLFREAAMAWLRFCRMRRTLAQAPVDVTASNVCCPTSMRVLQSQKTGGTAAPDVLFRADAGGLSCY
mmetsp:Transcript_162400/g.515962  ORF Transcript_162400/g.515962 Transcript_162400/m.515962 type:complete len:233 (-) Transcript_162400:485-1183(-)